MAVGRLNVVMRGATPAVATCRWTLDCARPGALLGPSGADVRGRELGSGPGLWPRMRSLHSGYVHRGPQIAIQRGW